MYFYVGILCGVILGLIAIVSGKKFREFEYKEKNKWNDEGLYPQQAYDFSERFGNIEIAKKVDNLDEILEGNK